MRRLNRMHSTHREIISVLLGVNALPKAEAPDTNLETANIVMDANSRKHVWEIKEISQKLEQAGRKQEQPQTQPSNRHQRRKQKSIQRKRNRRP